MGTHSPGMPSLNEYYQRRCSQGCSSSSCRCCSSAAEAIESSPPSAKTAAAARAASTVIVMPSGNRSGTGAASGADRCGGGCCRPNNKGREMEPRQGSVHDKRGYQINLPFLSPLNNKALRRRQTPTKASPWHPEAKRGQEARKKLLLNNKQRTSSSLSVVRQRTEDLRSFPLNHTSFLSSSVACAGYRIPVTFVIRRKALGKATRSGCISLYQETTRTCSPALN